MFAEKYSFVAFIAAVLVHQCQGDVNSPETSHCSDDSIVHYFGPGDLILGGLFDNLHVHGCTKVAEADPDNKYEGFATLHKQEAILFALEEINNRRDILPHTTLGFDIYDTCALKQLAVKQAINQVMYKETCRYVDDNFCSVSKYDRAKEVQQDIPYIGAIGAEWSSITSAINFHFSAFHLPTVSYFASSDELSDSEMFPYFLRVIPPDRFQVDAIFALLKHFHWTSVAFVYTDDNYGRKAFKLFDSRVSEHNAETTNFEEHICIAEQFGVDAKSTKLDFELIVTTIMSHYDTRVVILFTHPTFARLFFEAMRSMDAVGKFQLIGSDGWGSNAREIQQYSDVANGTLKLRFVDSNVPSFEQYFLNVSPNNNNPWFEEFKTQIPSLKAGYSKESGVSRVMDSVLVFALGLDALMKEECPDSDANCVAQIEDNFNGTHGKKLHDFMKQLNFIGYNKHNVSFDADGEDIGRYEMANFQCDSNNKCHLVPVGDWNSIQHWTINTSGIVWGGEEGTMPMSRCAGPPKWRHPWTIVICILDTIGLFVCIVVGMAYLANRHHPLIEASGAGVSFLILTGVIVSYLMVFTFVIKPSEISCYFVRSGYMVCFTAQFAPLLVHTWTIFRRYKAVKRGTRVRPGFTSSSSEIFISLSLILVQVAIAIVFLIVTPPLAKVVEPEHQLTCNQDFTELGVSVFYNVFLIILCSVFAFLTRKVPKNYKESRFIGFSVYTTLVIWVLFIPSYVNAPIANWKILILSFAMMVSASVTLIFLFLVKLYAIYWIQDEDTMDISVARYDRAMPAEVSWPSDGGRAGAGRTRSTRARSKSLVNVISSVGNFERRRRSYGEAIAARDPISTVSAVQTHSSLDTSAVYPPQALTGDGYVYPSEVGNWL